MNNMNKAFGIINFAGNHIHVDGLQELARSTWDKRPAFPVSARQTWRA